MGSQFRNVLLSFSVFSVLFLWFYNDILELL